MSFRDRTALLPLAVVIVAVLAMVSFMLSDTDSMANTTGGLAPAEVSGKK